ncbi:MAG: class I SAM-dependent methyltransferase [Phycisphaerae bacterium]|nr:class I SAM-dependent methyltransferase [Phycisphaerae bacterium]NIW92898.1 methyltransferase domain-containing protein [Phycisphaerae bacterium]NIW98366.1 methyltransferase domain-containing protein [Phycisphaerae bacterium]NIX28097.1 methyltransferase domain-containing protein [Phycisphaerae bacterium]
MATGKETETRSHIIGFKDEIDKAAQQSKDTFFTWFSSANDTDMAFVRGHWDFIIHIALPLSKYITQPETKVALEIGHGGGRILSAASRGFQKVIGVDIHDNNRLVEEELRKRGITNIELLKTDGQTIPIEDNSIDVVYSFIVLQHIERIKIFKGYLAESYRILKPGGLALLYFGRKYFFSINRKSRILYWIDCLLEELVLRQGFQEIPARVNETNLQISVSFAKKTARLSGFQVLGKVVSHKKVPDGINLYGGQHGLILKK